VILELTTDNIISIVAILGAGVSTVLGFGIRLVSNQNKELKEELDGVRDCLQNTRESYVTNERFDKVTDKIMGKLDAITELLSTKPDKGFCDIMHNRVTKLEK
jgi:hypothetical protein